jgi:hypothetical protein
VAQQLLTISMITREALRVLTNELGFTKGVNREYEDEFAKTGAKIGNTLNIRKPPRYTRTDGQGLQLQDVTETSVPLVLTTQAQRAFTFTSQDFLLSIDDFSKRFISPAIASMANQVDYDGLQLFSQVWNQVGTPGTIPNALLTYLQAKSLLDKNATPMDGERDLCITPDMEVYIVDTLKGLFQSSERIKEQYDKGEMGEAIGCTWKMDQNVATFTTGAFNGSTSSTVDCTTAPVSGATSIVTGGWGTGATVVAGDVFTIGGGGTTPVYMVNPQNYQPIPTLQQFVVTAPATASGGAMTINFQPAMTTSGPFQTINVLPTTGTTNGVLTFSGTYASTGQLTPQGLMYHRDAFTMACADLPLWKGTDMAQRAADKDLGLSIRLIRDYDINMDRAPTRLDFLYGWAVLYPQLACRIAS